MALTSTSPASSSDLWLKNKKKHFSAQRPLNQSINTSELRWIAHTSRQREGSCDWSASYHCRKAIRQTDTPWGRRRYRHTMKFSPSSWGGFLNFLNASLPWESAGVMGLSIQQTEASGSLALWRMEGEPSHPTTRAFLLIWLCSQPQASKPTLLF